ncbi:hypothetical protein TPHA_0J00950 [Tetrapisispora phaffii CBS 4417]|uniref:Mitochondrial fission 1 protein n=1 Tax=Tetrapisispora phaffii (strain ATCC 24235 / CBS 4417 / NBRC 1672 / NRRL Y-8282 / UCD 70-5) TaxID=1071381 RepID=G8BYH5_TETPH|nr:hypothetical protein TPHA_0J00950 [Tetrapisispora phaffii CBS 4417]CCE64917.1 hypothetical protein TPHA_0J00950 [Tetrapisispora phaffii CBS 4417]
MSKIDYLPTLQDAYEPLLPQQVEILRQIVVSEGGDAASIQSRFNYAWALIKSNDVNNQRLGIKLLTDIFKEASSRRRECLYYLTIGCYKVNEFTMARRYVNTLRENEPNNSQIIQLQKMVENKIQKEAWMGIAVATGVVAGAAAIAGMFMKSKRR